MPTITDYGALLETIASLPPCAPDHVRVFRGQTKNYDTMLPSGLRRSLRKQAIWNVYARHLHEDLAPPPDSNQELVLEQLRASSLWLQAVAQHYGPGSNFVDVTRSVDVALWFALNDIQELVQRGVNGPPGPPDPVRDHPTYAELLMYKAWTTDGFLYAWDLPVWEANTLATPGVVVDLRNAPSVYSDSPRMRAQQACLIYCGASTADAFDLRSHLILGTPLRVARPMLGAPSLERTVADLFPSPAVDSWYDRLLSVPMAYTPTTQPPSLQRSIPVSVYFDEGNETYMREVIHRNINLRLPLLHRAIHSDPEPLTIVLEAPLVFPFPPGDSDEWNHALLETDIPTECIAYEFDESAPASTVSLNDVLFEFSLLEYTGWESVVRDNADFLMLRGLWLRRGADGLSVAFLHHTVHDVNIKLTGFIQLRLDAASRQWLFVLRDGAGLPVTSDPSLAKGLLIVLMLLRHLSSTLKPDAIPQYDRISGGEHEMLVSVARDAAQLYRVASPVRDWYVLRSADESAEPFSHVSRPSGWLKLSSSEPYREMNSEEIRASACNLGLNASDVQ